MVPKVPELKLTILAWTASAVFSQPALACAILSPIDYTIFRQAQIVMSAEIVGYRKTELAAVFEFKPITLLTPGVWKVDQWKARWNYSTYEEPITWSEPKHVLVGLRARIDKEGKTYIEVVQQPCGPATILPDDNSNRDRILSALRDGAR